jgi:hypothetical protein
MVLPWQELHKSGRETILKFPLQVVSCHLSDQRLRMKGAIIGAVLDHGLAQDIPFVPIQEVSNLLHTRNYTCCLCRWSWRCSQSVCQLWTDGAYTLPINHRTVTAKAPMTSDEENVLRK